MASPGGGVPRVLVVDVGGSNVKLMVNDVDESRRFPSGPDLTAERFLPRS